VPDSAQPSQKAFDALLWRALRAFDPARPVLVESESRKIGQLHLPEPLMRRMRAAPCLRLDVPLAVRVRLLRDQYPHLEEDREGLMARLERLVPLYQDERVKQWRTLADAGRWDELVERLLLQHYDPAYHRSLLRNYAQSAQAADVSLAAASDAAVAAASDALLRELSLDRGA
jgi:tRNA 2-selenouridine synthase